MQRSVSRSDRRRLVTVSYGELDTDNDTVRRLRLEPARIVSLKAHPYAKPTDTAFLAAESAGVIVAILGLIPGRIRVDGQSFPISWGSGWYAEKSDPTAGSVVFLEAIRAGRSFGGCLLSPDALRVYRAAGIPLTVVPRYVVLRRSLSYWEQLTPPLLARVVHRPTNLALAIWRALGLARSPSPIPGWSIEEVPRFDERLDAIEAARADRFLFPRDHRELNWVMDHPWDPGCVYRCFYARPHDDPRPTAYAWVRTRTYGRARVSSIFRTGAAGNVAGLRALFRAVMRALERDDPDLIEVAGTDRILIEEARRGGMLRHGQLDAGCRFAPDAQAALVRASAGLASFRIDMAEGDVLFL